MGNKIIRQGHKINALNSANLENIDNVEFNMWCITYHRTMTLTTVEVTVKERPCLYVTVVPCLLR